jgi:hypothetical protein
MGGRELIGAGAAHGCGPRALRPLIVANDQSDGGNAREV